MRLECVLGLECVWLSGVCVGAGAFVLKWECFRRECVWWSSVCVWGVCRLCCFLKCLLGRMCVFRRRCAWCSGVYLELGELAVI